ncbi:MAG: hypothetical protein RR572_08080, partial [Raoultibacter sp.]
VTDAVSITATFKEIPAPPKPPVDSTDPINPPTPPVASDNGGNNNGGGTTTIVERTNTVTVPAAPQAAAPETPALGAQAFDMQHSHIPLALLLLAVWLVGGFAVIRQRKHTHDAIEGTSY